MRLSIPHWILVAVALLGTVAPQVGTAFPALAPAMAIVTQLATLVVGALGLFTASVVTPAAAKAIPLACLAFLCACSPALFGELSNLEKDVAADLASNASEAQMASDVCRDLGGSSVTDAVCADVPAILNDTIALLVDGGWVKGPAAANARSYQEKHAVLRGERSGSAAVCK